MSDVSIKAKILRAVNDLPENSTIEDAIERLVLLRKVEIGLKQGEDGQTISLENVENGLRQKRQSRPSQ